MAASPNEWAKAIKAGPPGELTQTKLQQLDFWTKFKEYAQNKKSGIHFGHTPRPQHWYNVGMGSSEAHIALTIDSRKNTLGCEIYIDRNKDLFKYLQERKDEIESEIGDKVEWVDAPSLHALWSRKRWEVYLHPARHYITSSGFMIRPFCSRKSSGSTSSHTRSLQFLSVKAAIQRHLPACERVERHSRSAPFEAE